ncbi:uncharacterized protein LOC143596135 [Bidens hawaiensis]|uniref:uncharacterized protein LOC143596135 n=1 Tax=Bidens hawaiensis TaxID=980011 RepID=UPI00404B6564
MTFSDFLELRESQITGPELVQETTDRVAQIRQNLIAARSRLMNYANKRRKPLEFNVGDRVLIKAFPWKGVVRFGKKRNLSPRFVGPFEILDRVIPLLINSNSLSNSQMFTRCETPVQLAGTHVVRVREPARGAGSIPPARLVKNLVTLNLEEIIQTI